MSAPGAMLTVAPAHGAHYLSAVRARAAGRRTPAPRATWPSERSRPSLALLALACAGCLTPGAERAALDLQVGQATGAGLAVAVDDGLAAIRLLDADRLELWSQAPALAIAIEREEGEEPPRWPVPARTLTLAIHNLPAGAVLTALAGDQTPLPIGAPLRFGPTSYRWALPLPAVTAPAEQARLRVLVQVAAPAPSGPWRLAVLSDIQDAIDRVQEIFDRINADPEVRLVLSTGDLTERGSRAELTRFQAALAGLAVPFYTTLGNHELLTDEPRAWHELFGRHSLHWRHGALAVSLLDAAAAGIDPQVERWLDGWMESEREQVHLVLTHYPPFDPVGVRGGGFRSRVDASRLVRQLVDGGVAATFHGHLHSYFELDLAGIPAYVSGGGGAIPERLDGLGRHYLTVDVDAGGVQAVAVVCVD